MGKTIRRLWIAVATCCFLAIFAADVLLSSLFETYGMPIVDAAILKMHTYEGSPLQTIPAEHVNTFRGWLHFLFPVTTAVALAVLCWKLGKLYRKKDPDTDPDKPVS
ncbi:MAG: hypothetical protein O0X93_00190 [Methanocorpusculum sp.]|nr:hypothetical protein [Methanocorpusculum sp.]MDE2521562.1 hypothetical protein [Methanocorpusculum sp.]MDE2525221.1 hypothetical protein [Methanocorpusculum sp.]